ncbi:hypothetical protein J4N46_01750 [Capnocytophaga sp. Marseille-Q4570]|uniref:Uncharacterized protein n=1 Tax=Capnocytophaga bilenii TaxID=2819369 RepID=A0ABS3PV24_9FLAO|nr:hypothetical protein [Capnocytophaga bilenii]MBO1883176.1 hypothetical protein [Capnocytophaga bilenii]
MEIDDKYKKQCGKIATCEENKKKFTLNNATGFVKVQIDGGVLSLNDKATRCDFLLFKEENLKRLIEIFVELKGIDVLKALEQLEGSIQMFAKSSNQYAMAVVTKMIPTTAIQRKINDLTKKKKVKLHIKVKSLQCDYNAQTNTLDAIRN